MKANVEALSLELTPEDVQEIEKGYEFDIGFPHKFMGFGGMIQGPQDINILAMMGHFDYVASSKAIRPHKGELAASWQSPT